MNSFKTMITIFSVLVATCAGSNQYQSWGSQAAVPALPSQSGMGSYGNKVWGPAAAPAQQSFVAPAATVIQQQFPASTQQVCTCVALPAAGQQSGSSSASQSAPIDNQQQSGPATTQTFIAPAAAPSSSTQSYGAPAQQAAFRPAGGDRVARPSYAAPATKGSGY